MKEGKGNTSLCYFTLSGACVSTDKINKVHLSVQKWIRNMNCQ